MTDHEHTPNNNTRETSKHRSEICDCGARRRTPRYANGDFGDPAEWRIPSWVKGLDGLDSGLENLGDSKSFGALSFFGTLIRGAISLIWILIWPILVVLVILFLALGG